MSLKNIHLKKWYDSDTDDILNSFYIPALSNSIKYKRLAGFFSSSSLAICAKGIITLVKNGGKIELITSPKFKHEDIEAIKEAYESIENVTEKIMLDEFENLYDDFISDHVKAFGWLLKNHLLEIKIVIIQDESGTPLEETEVKRRGIFHQKVGIMEDSEGNKISFSGSENESAYAWKYNIEEFKVFRDWETSELPYFMSDELKFEKYWENNSQKAQVIDLPDAVQRKMIEIAPVNFEDINLEKWYDYDVIKKITLREYQIDAINSWFENNQSGIFEMATGTGKTFTALGCVEKTLEKEDKLLTIISCPYNHLITQWEKEINVFGLEVSILIADSTKANWDKKLADYLLDFNIDLLDRLIILTTHDTLSSKRFINLLKKIEVPSLLIVDEVHGIGAPKRKEGLLSLYNYRLGLSATPKRWFDEEGTSVIFDYFNDTVYQYPLSKAIGTFLIDYEYYPHFVNLTNDELDEYKKQTEKIVKTYYSSDDNKEKEEIYNLLCILRQNIVKNADQKYIILEKLIDENPEISHCLVYCSPQQIQKIQNILLQKNIKQHKFTEEEGTRPTKKFNEMSQRDFLLKNFTEGTLQILVAMKCLDEGVNVPPARIAIMMSNSGNPKEYVQRRGRVLRKYPGKKVAQIHDVIVIPTNDQYSNYEDLERKIFSKEIKRYKEFSQLAKNSIQCTAIIERLEFEYKVFE
ncbi:MAG: DEAD/DEAH box helicase family protein [Candidatus Odinarchaeia archaeon]